MRISPKSDISTLKGVGDKLKNTFNKIGVFTIGDLIKFVPFRYRDTTDILTIKDFKDLGEGTFLAQIVDVKNVYTKFRRGFTKVRVQDSTDRIDFTYFNQTYLTKSLKPSEWYIFDGKFSIKGKKKNVFNPKYEKYQGDPEMQVNLGKIYGIYHETTGLTSRQIRKILLSIKEEIPRLQKEYLPKNILEKEHLVNISDALVQIHFPDSKEALELSHNRLAFDEMLGIGIKIESQIKEHSSKISIPIKTNTSLAEDFLKSLPYKLTKDQDRSIQEIFKDISKKTPMNRMLNGDVGSGKTVVAAASILQMVKAGYSTILLAPTTVLAKQHLETLQSFLKPFDVDIELCISEEKTISQANNKLIIGTHAILYQKELPTDLNLVIVDEQHRFGVEQRESLLSLGETTPHYLTMTATPIPRSLTEVVFGSTEVSTIKEKPKDRIEVITKYVPTRKRSDCMEWINKEIKESDFTKQAFIIYPLIEDNDTEIKSVLSQYEDLSSSYFSDLKVAFLHGRMKDKEKTKILKNFKNKKYNILISTSVIEVGIDITDATVMVIENAERFGLAQLHQLRGRVGRGDVQSYCFVLTNEDIEEKEKSVERLRYFASHSSGFDVAQYDLESRGPGEVYGVTQSGIPQFKIANLGDLELLKKTRGVAIELLLGDTATLNKISKNLFR